MATTDVRVGPLGPGLPEEKRQLRRDVGLIGLMFTSLGSIIGSGWLFGSLYAAQEAGPSALISWGIGGGAVIILALIYAEMGGMYSVAGGTARFPHYAFGSLVGFAAGWFAWLGAVTIAPIEVEAAIQYSTNYLHGLSHKVTMGSEHVVVLTPKGYVVAAVLMLIFTVINLMGIRHMSKTNVAAVWWKIAVPVLTILVLLAVAFHPGNFTAAGGFAPAGAKGVLQAITAGGVIFALLGFEQAIQLAGEGRNAHRDIPVAVIGSIVIGVVIYLLLQVAFLGALKPGDLAHGWSNLTFSGVFGPFAGLAKLLGLGWLAVLLYIDAVISPAGTGLIYTATSSRVSYALGRNGYVPKQFDLISQQGVPWFSIIFSFIVGMLLFLPFPSWQTLVTFISSATALTYAAAPLALGALRRQEPDRRRPYRLPGGNLLAPVGFMIANLIVYWSGWNTDRKLFAAILLGFALLAISYLTKANPDRPPLDWKSSLWLWPYLAGMALISYLGQFDGREVIPFWWDMLTVAAFSLVIYAFAMRVRLPADRVRQYIGEVEG
jgi:amino acid transporter